MDVKFLIMARGLSARQTILSGGDGTAAGGGRNRLDSVKHLVSSHCSIRYGINEQDLKGKAE